MESVASGPANVLSVVATVVAALFVAYVLFRIYRDGPLWAKVTLTLVLIALALALAAGMAYLSALARAFSGP